MIVVDAGVLIGHLDSSDRHHDRATALLRGAGATSLAASPISIAEVLVGPSRAGFLDRARAAIAQLQIATIWFAEDAPARLATMRAATSLKLPDCCVLLAAEQADRVVATFDQRLADLAHERGFTVLPG